MPLIGPMELIMVLALALLVLGPKRLPDAGRAMGRGLLEFKDAVTMRGAAREELDAAVQAAPTAPATRSA